MNSTKKTAEDMGKELPALEGRISSRRKEGKKSGWKLC